MKTRPSRLFFVALALAFGACDVGHKDYAIDLDLHAVIMTASNEPIEGAQIQLKENGRAVADWPLICSSDSAGRCAGKASFRFGRNYYGWRGKRPGSVLALWVAAPGYETESIPLDSLTSEEVAGLRPVTRKVQLRPRTGKGG